VPRLSVWLVRSALLALMAGTALGAVLLAAPGFGWTEVLRWRPLHAELLLVGWLVQLALGVSWWILPRFRSGAERGPEGLGWLAFGLVNAGAILAGVGRSVGLDGLALAGRGAEALAAAAYAARAWPRVKPFR
jgi:cbb3-type cytochrome oxidase subunit 1